MNQGHGSRPGYIFEDSPEGRSLVVTGPWSDEAAQALDRGDADGLVLNYARGFCEASLDLLDSRWQLRRLDLLDRSIEDLAPLRRLPSLESISIQVSLRAVLDLTAFPRLRAVAGEWMQIAPTLDALPALESVSTWQFADDNLRAFRDHPGLRRVTISDAPYLESLAGLDGLSEVSELAVVLAPRLTDIADVGDLSTSLRELTFEACRGIDSISVVEPLVDLRFLGVNDCGDIASLAPLESLHELTTFYAWGTTRIVDGDLSPLASLPRLREVRMRNRRDYRPAVGDLPTSKR